MHIYICTHTHNGLTKTVNATDFLKHLISCKKYSYIFGFKLIYFQARVTFKHIEGYINI